MYSYIYQNKITQNMKTSYQNSRKHSIHPLIDKRAKRVKYSLSETEQIKTYDILDKITAQNGIKPKTKPKMNRKNKEENHINNLNIQPSNIQLQRQTNKLSLREDHQKQKNRIINLNRSISSKRPITSKKLNAQFQKQMYWNGNNTYMITGIKYQYQKIKEALQKKTFQYEELLKAAHTTSQKQLKKYIEVLQIENRMLVKNTQALNAKNIKISEISPVILRENVIQKEQKIKKLKQSNKKIKAQLKQSQLKINFLQKLIIDKDNNEHNMAKICKKVQKEKENDEQKIKQLESQIEQLRTQHDEEVFKLKNQFYQLMASKKQSLTQSRKQYTAIINRLQKQNKYLQSLVDCWKDQMHKKTQKADQQSPKVLITENQHQKVKEKENLQSSDSSQGQNVYLNNVNNELQTERVKRTMPYTCQIKNSQNYKKNRRLQLHQIQNIIQISRYILINKQITLDKFISHFEPKDHDTWNQQYINMKEIQQQFLCVAELPQNQAHMMARYLVQHATTQFVYTDELNEHHRSVVKSIIRNIYKQYSVYTDYKIKFQQVIQSQREKLQFSLQNISKSGLINVDKFKDLIAILSLKIDPGFDIYCISKMIRKSESLQKLQYKHLFQNINPLLQNNKGIEAIEINENNKAKNSFEKNEQNEIN